MPELPATIWLVRRIARECRKLLVQVAERALEQLTIFRICRRCQILQNSGSGKLDALPFPLPFDLFLADLDRFLLRSSFFSGFDL